MKIAIDLNDVLRDYTANFGEYFKKGYDKDINLDEIEITTNDLSEVFPFKSRYDYEHFVYEDFAWELFAKCPSCERGLGAAFSNWVTKTITNIDVEEPIDIIIVSTMEYGITIPATYWFISKLGCRAREIYLPTDSSTIWDKCDVLITANPKLLLEKPEGKKSVKIKTDYNADCDADFEYNNMLEFLSRDEYIEKLVQ
jgi:hypothetical protein